MKITFIFATGEGQTEKIARFCVEHLERSGHEVRLVEAGPAVPGDLENCDAAILAASVHLSNYQLAMVDFARQAISRLRSLPTLFLSVSLSAAGSDPDDWEGLDRTIGHFLDQTGWYPGRIEHVAGAFRFSHYGWLRRQALRWIAWRKGESIDTHQDKEYTDWDALSQTLDDWAARVSAGISPSESS